MKMPHSPSRHWVVSVCWLAIWFAAGWPAAAQSTYARAGWQATLSTVSHGVRGTATILDENTYRVDNFHYDGFGITVYFYLGATDTRADFLQGLSTGPDLIGTPYNGGSITIDLPPGKTFDDYRAVSVWCTAAGVSFGSGTFMPYVRAGWQAPLSTVSHGVRGTVTLVDADTFRVDNFYYDGLGISVFFYLGATDLRASFSAGLAVGPQLLRSNPYVNESLTVHLPAGRTFTGYQAISVWCVGIGSSFGSGTFVSPRENWRKSHFTSSANSGNGADPLDFDKDGQANLLEYATRTDPRAPGASPWNPPVSMMLPGSVPALQFTFNYRPESRDIRYLVLASPDLATWTEIYRNDPRSGVVTRAGSLASQENPATQSVTLTEPAPSAGLPLFWRLAVEPVP